MKKKAKMRFKNVVLIGPGLIVGSLVLDMRSAQMMGQVVAYARSLKTKKAVLRKKICQKIGVNLESDLRQADLVILGTPVLTTLHLIKKIARFISDDCLVMDVGSTKLSAVKAAQKYFKKGQFVPCHPMAGREVSGPEAAVRGLFQKRFCVLSTYPQLDKKFLRHAIFLWKRVGAQVVLMEASRHDQMVALTSHLPQILASALMNVVGRRTTKKPLIFGSGLQDMTRLARSSSAMWTDILVDNQKPVLLVLREFSAEIKNVMRLLRSKDTAGISAFFQAANHFKDHLKIFNRQSRLVHSREIASVKGISQIQTRSLVAERSIGRTS